MKSMSSQDAQPPAATHPSGLLLAPSAHRTHSTLVRGLETALAPPRGCSASVTDHIELEEWWSLTPERLRRIFKEFDADNDGQLKFLVPRRIFTALRPRSAGARGLGHADEAPERLERRRFLETLA